jgi:hypothetical protein
MSGLLLGLATVQNLNKISQDDHKINQKGLLWLLEKVKFATFPITLADENFNLACVHTSYIPHPNDVKVDFLNFMKSLPSDGLLNR